MAGGSNIGTTLLEGAAMATLGPEIAPAIGGLTGLSGAGLTAATGALTGAGVGGLGAALTGRNALQGALMGGAAGGIGGGLGGLMSSGAPVGAPSDFPAPAAGGAPVSTAAPIMSPGAAQAASDVADASAFNNYNPNAAPVNTSSLGTPGNVVQNPQVPIQQSAMNVAGQNFAPSDATATAGGLGQYTSGNANFMGPPTPDALTAQSLAGNQAGSPDFWSGFKDFATKHPYITGGAALTAYMAATGAFKPNYLPAYKQPTYGLQGLGAGYKPTFAMKEGGIAMAMGGVPGQMYPQSSINANTYAAPTQMPTSAMDLAGVRSTNTPMAGPITQNMAPGGLTAAGEDPLGAPLQTYQPTSNPTSNVIQQMASRYGVQLPSGLAAGGSINSHLGGYSDGGRLLKGPGDGMSDDIPASIADKQPARLADGEFVVPADVVSHLGNGSTDAGAKHLYSMMDNVRKARTGHTKQGKQIKAEKYLPA